MNRVKRIDQLFGGFFANTTSKPSKPKVEYQVYDQDLYASCPAYCGNDLEEAKRVASKLPGSEIVEVAE